jgi:hypothetical protein
MCWSASCVFRSRTRRGPRSRGRADGDMMWMRSATSQKSSSTRAFTGRSRMPSSNIFWASSLTERSCQLSPRFCVERFGCIHRSRTSLWSGDASSYLAPRRLLDGAERLDDEHRCGARPRRAPTRSRCAGAAPLLVAHVGDVVDDVARVLLHRVVHRRVEGAARAVVVDARPPPTSMYSIGCPICAASRSTAPPRARRA